MNRDSIENNISLPSEWFKEWFNTEEYHQLYQHRDRSEAEKLIANFVRKLKLLPGNRVVDLACGRGRHSSSLHDQGLEVTGLDLSEMNIRYAKEHRHPDIQFLQHDMRKPFPVMRQNAVFNLFTSFGYFETENEHLTTLKNVFNSLEPGGFLIMDYFNVGLLQGKIIPFDTIHAGGTRFQIRRSVKDQKIFKEISFEKDGIKKVYVEQVQAFTRSDFHRLMNQSGFSDFTCFGDYDLNEFEMNVSPRLIILASKPIGSHGD